jgi:hypothetical protein
MSVDNYYEVRIHPLGGFTYIMGFASDNEPTRNPQDFDPQYMDIWNAYKAAIHDDVPAEHGVTFHPECEAALRDYWGPATTTL